MPSTERSASAVVQGAVLVWAARVGRPALHHACGIAVVCRVRLLVSAWGRGLLSGKSLEVGSFVFRVEHSKM